ncbi:conserved hypothetical protein [Levilactobacillus brevis KB290]|uniref:Uncharacterized protein n=1 Tax=Levilactobacillus brevis KB290 TaxID=1001583 RepID=M5ACY4_LEVBR|nr:conserved hypothetical protein [Levilactobacillus brevis KB290]
MIQYLPCLLLLATFSFERAVANVRQLYAGYHRRVVAAIAADNLEQEK